MDIILSLRYGTTQGLSQQQQQMNHNKQKSKSAKDKKKSFVFP